MPSIQHPLPGSSGKVCTKCGQEKPFDDFYVKIKATGRRFSWCKECHKVRCNAKYVPKPKREPPTEKRCPRCERTLPVTDFAYRTGNAGQRRAWCKECRKVEKSMYRATHLESIRALAKAYYAANKEAVDERIRRSIAAKPEKYQAIHAAWKQANKDAVNASTHKRRAAVKGNGGKWTASEWQAIKAAQEYLCLMCGRKEPDIRLCFDHIIPVSLGGPNTAANGQGLCKSCNSKKHRRVLDLRKEV